MKLFDYVISLDSNLFMAHKTMYLYEMLYNNLEKAEIHKKWLIKTVPWYFPLIDSAVQKDLQQLQKQ